MNRFDGKVIVITGGAVGIGRRYAHRFAAEGAHIVIADRDMAAAELLVDQLTVGGTQALACEVDVSDQPAVERAVAAVVERFGGIDVLVNNAAIHHDHAQLPFTAAAIPQWRRVLDVNVIGALICSTACREAMAGRGASIINHSSMAAWSGGSAYAVSKLALNALTVGLAEAFADDGIRVTGIAPGLVDSETSVEWMGEHPGVGDMLIGRQLVKRLGTMDDIADMAMFLCSDAAGFITGQTLLVDGGFTRKAF
jgi:3-oxoacyl-[acyl-carrier protein] reductase